MSDEQRGGKENHQQAALIRANRKAHNVSQMGPSCIDWFHVDGIWKDHLSSHEHDSMPLDKCSPIISGMGYMPYDIFIPLLTIHFYVFLIARG
jgi:hypothetical protein